MAPITSLDVRSDSPEVSAEALQMAIATELGEARYNRAICLTRLGRTGEARRALTPFARGDYGDYRREEGKTLLGETSR